MLRHAIYFETLSSIADDASPEWKATAAGLFVLRLVDHWLALGPQAATTEVSSAIAVRDAISRVSDGDPARSLLSQVVDAVEQADSISAEAVIPSLMAYSQALLYAGAFDLEKDVLVTVQEYATASGDRETLIRTAIRLGIIVRNEGNLDLAEEYHTTAERYALEIGDQASILQARLGRAKTTANRGNLPLADTLCAEVAKDAAQSGIKRMRGYALHDRAFMAYLRGNYQDCVRFAHQALDFVETNADRDRVMADLAAAFASLGHVSASRDTNLILASCAQEQHVRWRANINLMHCAVQEWQEAPFELYRAMLALAPLPTRLKIYYHAAAAEGFRTFGKLAEAEEEFRQAHELASQHNMQQVVFELEATMSRQPEQAGWSSDIDKIADDIEEKLRLHEYSFA